MPLAAAAEVRAGPRAAFTIAQVLREGLAALLPGEGPVPSHRIPPASPGPQL